MLSPFHCVWLFATLWTIAHQAPLIHAILQARILEWLPCPPPGDLSNPGIKPASPALQADSLLLSHRGRELLLHSDYQTLLSKRIIILQNIFYLPSLKTLLSNRKKKKKRKTIYRATTVLAARESPSGIKFLVFPVNVKEYIWISNKKILVRGVYVKTDKCGKIKKAEEWTEGKRHGFGLWLAFPWSSGVKSSACQQMESYPGPES